MVVSYEKKQEDIYSIYSSKEFRSPRPFITYAIPIPEVLPFMAQGASSAIEDAEAIAFCLVSITDPAQVPAALHRAWRIRYQRVSTIQRYGRQPGIGPDITHHGEKKLNPMELAACREFGYKYNGAEAWEKEHPEML